MEEIYESGSIPWDQTDPPPEVIALAANLPVGRALDLGCGSGTNVLNLARAGWQVTGVDFAIKAAARARYRLKQARLAGEILQRDVTDLADLNSGYNLVLDIGCYHSLPLDKKVRYEANLDRLLVKQGWFLLYGIHNETNPSFGLTEEDINRLSDLLELKSRQNGDDRGLRRSVWLKFQKD